MRSPCVTAAQERRRRRDSLRDGDGLGLGAVAPSGLYMAGHLVETVRVVDLLGAAAPWGGPPGLIGSVAGVCSAPRPRPAPARPAAQLGAEGIEALGPEVAELRQPRVDLPSGPARARTAAVAPPPSPGEAVLPQDAEVLGDRGVGRCRTPRRITSMTSFAWGALTLAEHPRGCGAERGRRGRRRRARSHCLPHRLIKSRAKYASVPSRNTPSNRQHHWE